jgi:hypothetical protein
MYFMLSFYMCAYINLTIGSVPNKTLKYIRMFIYAIGLVNLIMVFVSSSNPNIFFLIFYFLNLLLSGGYMYLIKSFKINWKNTQHFLMDVACILTPFFVFLFSIINILEYYGIF